MDFVSRISLMVVLFALTANATKYRAYRVMANVEVSLTCWELEDPNDLVVWITPSETIIGPNYQGEDNKYKIDMDGSLIVNDTIKSDTGTYKCLSQPTPGIYNKMEVQLEVIDTSYLPEIDEWEKNLTRGLIASACTAGFFLAACGFKYFNWEERHPKNNQRKSAARSSSGSISRRSHPSSVTSSDPSTLQELKGVDNPALTVDTSEIDSGL